MKTSIGTLNRRKIRLTDINMAVVELVFPFPFSRSRFFFRVLSLTIIIRFPINTMENGMKSPKQASIHDHGKEKNQFINGLDVVQIKIASFVLFDLSIFLKSKLKKKWLFTAKRVSAIMIQTMIILRRLQRVFHLNGMVTEIVRSTVRRIRVHDASWWE